MKLRGGDRNAFVRSCGSDVYLLIACLNDIDSISEHKCYERVSSPKLARHCELISEVLRPSSQNLFRG